MLLLFGAVCLSVFAQCQCSFEGLTTPPHHKEIPQDVMVGVVNRLGLKLLAVHNKNNENNIAISPYGTLAVLIAIQEGTKGPAADEIFFAANIPPNLSLIRIGLRDIHRHLKSYFIPKEGFLAGLTLNQGNISLTCEYKEVLKFYGFDIEAFNKDFYDEFYKAQGNDSIILNKGSEEEMNSTEINTEGTLNIEEDVTNSSNETVTESTINPSGETESSTETDTLGPNDPNTETEDGLITSSPEGAETTTLSESAPEEGSSPMPEEDSESIPETTTALNEQAPSPEGDITESENDATTTGNPDSETEIEAITTQPTLEKAEGSADNETTASEEATTEAGSTENVKEASESESATEASNTEDAGGDDTTKAGETTEVSENAETTETPSKKRSVRSIEDYIIAQYFDSLAVTHHPPPGPHFFTQHHAPRFHPIAPPVLPSFPLYPAVHPVSRDQPLPSPPEQDVDDDYSSNEDYEVDADYMSYDAVLPYFKSSTLSAQILRFPLDNPNYYLLLILPNQNEDIDHLINNLVNYDSLGNLVKNLRDTRVQASIPGFSLKGIVVLTPTLQKLGIRGIFEPNGADFSKMTLDPDIYITNIEQAITVNIRNFVEDKDTNNKRNLQQYDTVEFTADHPFLYFVMDSELHVCLMAGKIINPLNSRIS